MIPIAKTPLQATPGLPTHVAAQDSVVLPIPWVRVKACMELAQKQMLFQVRFVSTYLEEVKLLVIDTGLYDWHQWVVRNVCLGITELETGDHVGINCDSDDELGVEVRSEASIEIPGRLLVRSYG